MIPELQKKLKALAALEALVEPSWEYRYFSYNAKWSDSEEMGSMRDGCGGEWFLWSTGELAAYKCLSIADGLIDDIEQVKSSIPSEYQSFINEPAFSMDTSTCIWYVEESAWIKLGHSVKGLIDLDSALAWSASDYHAWATDYYEKDFDLSVIETLFSGQYSNELALQLNPDANLTELQKDLVEIGL